MSWSYSIVCSASRPPTAALRSSTRGVRLAGAAGGKGGPAGGTFPYGKDPRDRNIRLAPSMPSIDENRDALEVFCTCVELACADMLRAE